MTLAASPMHATRLPSSDKIGLPMKCGIFRFSIQIDLAVSISDTISNADLSSGFFREVRIYARHAERADATSHLEAMHPMFNVLHPLAMHYISCAASTALHSMCCI